MVTLLGRSASGRHTCEPELAGSMHLFPRPPAPSIILLVMHTVSDSVQDCLCLIVEVMATPAVTNEPGAYPAAPSRQKQQSRVQLRARSVGALCIHSWFCRSVRDRQQPCHLFGQAVGRCFPAYHKLVICHLPGYVANVAPEPLTRGARARRQPRHGISLLHKFQSYFKIDMPTQFVAATKMP